MNDHRFYIPSKRYGDRHPRTLQEAFGPYAKLDIDSNKLPGTWLLPWIVCGCYLAYLLYRLLPAIV